MQRDGIDKERGDYRMKSKNTEALIRDRENLRDLLEDIMEQILSLIHISEPTRL